MRQREKSVLNFFDTEYLEYALHVVQHRAIPSCIDGLKPTQRKIIYVANNIWKTGNEKPMKLFQLGGRVAAESYYHHGNSSLDSAMVGMAQSFKNSMPLLKGVGQFGSLRTPAAGAPRYISGKLHPNFRLLYKDFNLLDNKIEEGQKIEPEFFLPIIPTVILNGSSGIAVGFASNILNRNPVDIIDACIAVLMNKKINKLNPWLDEFSGTFTRDTGNPNKWKIKGVYDVKNTTTVKVTEIPPKYDYEKYEKHLNKLEETGKIVSYEDNSSENIDYEIKFRRSDLKDLISKNKIEKFLKLETRETENLTTIDETGNLKIFNKAEEIVEYFVKFRLSWYQKRKDFIINQINDKIKKLKNKARFIQEIITGSLKVNNVPKSQIIKHLKIKKYDKIDNSFNYLLNMPIYSLTKERFKALNDSILEEKNELKIIQDKDIITIYLDDLKNLKKVINK